MAASLTISGGKRVWIWVFVVHTGPSEELWAWANVKILAGKISQIATVLGVLTVKDHRSTKIYEYPG